MIIFQKTKVVRVKITLIEKSGIRLKIFIRRKIKNIIQNFGITFQILIVVINRFLKIFSDFSGKKSKKFGTNKKLLKNQVVRFQNTIVVILRIKNLIIFKIFKIKNEKKSKFQIKVIKNCQNRAKKKTKKSIKRHFLTLYGAMFRTMFMFLQEAIKLTKLTLKLVSNCNLKKLLKVKFKT